MKIATGTVLPTNNDNRRQGVEPTKISLVIPVRNESSSVGELVSTIRQQTRLPDEVLLVDGGSTDDTVQRIRNCDWGQVKFVVIEAGPATPGRGRNIGIAHAANDWIALTDAGIRLQSNWLEQLTAAAESNPDADVVYGSYEPTISSFFERCAALAYVAPRQIRNGLPMRGPSTASMMIRKNAWESVGGFPDLRAAEDLIFFERLTEQNHKVAWAPEAIVHWQLQPSIRSTYRKFKVYSKHNAWAGRQKDWHHGIVKIWLVLATLLCLSIGHSAWWWVPFLLMFWARVIRRILKHLEQYGWGSLLNPLVILGVAAVTLTIDLATFVGWIQAAVSKDPQGSLPAPQTAVTHVTS